MHLGFKQTIQESRESCEQKSKCKQLNRLNFQIRRTIGQSREVVNEEKKRWAIQTDRPIWILSVRTSLSRIKSTIYMQFSQNVADCAWRTHQFVTHTYTHTFNQLHAKYWTIWNHWDFVNHQNIVVEYSQSYWFQFIYIWMYLYKREFVFDWYLRSVMHIWIEVF